MKRILLLVFLIFALTSCQNTAPRRPINKSKTSFLTSSAQRNKMLLAREEDMLKKAVLADSFFDFNRSETGYFFAYKKQANLKLPLPQKGELVHFEYQVATLDNRLLYDRAEMGKNSYAIDQEDLLPALREGLRIMREGDVVVFLFPSYLCFGYQGDGHKIEINQPLRFTIWRLSNP